jgi:hypothetical protein
MAGRNRELIRPLIKKAKKANFRVETTSGGHQKLIPPMKNGEKGKPYFFPTSPGSAKTAYMLKSYLRKQGVPV